MNTDDHDQGETMTTTETMTMTHPDYPPPNGDPCGDRCICGGIRHWHAVAPYGCDDCDCTEFKETP